MVMYLPCVLCLWSPVCRLKAGSRMQLVRIPVIPLSTRIAVSTVEGDI
jgi:hypothetical protein